MKKILITGEKSYIGTSLINWMNKYDDIYSIDIISIRDNTWKDKYFGEYDVIVNVAGIAHIKPKPDLQDLFYKVNRDLTISIANKALEEGVSQFIFLSSMNVFGDTNETITKNTVPRPRNFYGDSKLQADISIQKLNSESFKVVSIRPPVVYGANCKGNFNLLSKFAKKIPIFPEYKNRRSMIYIDNLCELIRLIIDNEESGVFHPQNKEYISTTDIVKKISKIYEKHLITTKLFNPFIRFFINKNKLMNKIFADDLYDKELSNYKNFSYCVVSFEDSIMLTEKNSRGEDNR
jgi:nucleoside-diphosphate-sugar epimerase